MSWAYNQTEAGLKQALVALKKAHLALIEESPTEITIRRETVGLDRGSRTKVESFHGPYRVRVYLTGTCSHGEIRKQQGNVEKRETWSLLAPAMADLKDGPRRDDEFDAPPWGRFRIENLIPVRFRGVTFGYQAELERL